MLKKKTYRNRAYLDWVKTLDCCNCGAPADDPHHIIGQGEGGMGTKASDLLVMPLCRGCHTHIHSCHELWEMQWKWVAKTLERAIEEEVL
jgi:hypothetical protein